MIIEFKTRDGRVWCRFEADGWQAPRPAPAAFVPRWNGNAKEDRRAREGRVGSPA